jgi:hypothetical protein
VRVNRDDIRTMLHNGRYVARTTERVGTEHAVTFVRDAMINTVLSRGRSVVCDDTNLPQRVVRGLQQLALLNKAEFEVWDMTDIDLGTCITRDADRGARGGRSVGANVITDMHTRFIRGRSHPLPLPDLRSSDLPGVNFTPYVAPDSGVPTYLVDLDGTVAIMNGRSPYDETRVGEDLPNLDVIRVIRALDGAGYRVIYMSGRTDSCFVDTVEWIEEHVGVYGALYMRRTGDTRRDSVVKAELFDEYIRHSAEVKVVGIFDDRKQVVEMWRALGLTVFQVAEGDF